MIFLEQGKFWFALLLVSFQMISVLSVLCMVTTSVATTVQAKYLLQEEKKKQNLLTR